MLPTGGSLVDAAGHWRYGKSWMALQGPRDFSSFGWSVGCGGRKEGQVRDDVRSLVDDITARWRSVFPREQGYEVSVSSPAGPSNGAQLEVRRGDFRARVSVESILDPNRKSHEELAIRMYGRAESLRLTSLDRDAHQLTTRCRIVGVSLGLVAFFASAWVAFGVAAPIYVLGGLLMVVLALLVTTLGSSIGAFVAERLTDGARGRTVAESVQSLQFQEGLRRWRALSRQFAAEKQALTGQVGHTPFRALPAGPSARHPTPDGSLAPAT